MAYIKLFKEMWHYSQGKHWKVILFFLLHIFSHVGALSIPLIFAQILNIVQLGGENLFQDIAFWMVVWVVIFTSDAFLHRFGRILEFQVSYKIYRDFINRQYQKITNLPLKWHTDHHSGDTINRINTSGTALREFTEAQFMYVEHVIMFWGPIIALSLLSWQAALIAFFVAIIAIVVIYHFDLKLVKLYHDLNENRHHVASAVFDYISNIRTIITLRLGNRTGREIDRRMEQGYDIHVQSEGIVNGVKWTTVGFIILFLQLSILLYYIWTQHAAGAVILAGNLVAMYQYLERLSRTFFGIAADYQQVLNWNTKYEAAKPVFEAGEAEKSKISAPETWNKASVSRLNFEYEGGKQTLCDIDLSFAKGDRVALVGESGSGKSSIMAVMRGLFEPQSVSLDLDSQKFETLSPLFETTTLIPQEPEVFENTIGYNITVGIDYPEADVMEAIRLACFDRVLERLANGLETDVREKGVTLSGGERQRLALARGILAAKNSSIILMDEPTSSVDAHNELVIYENIFEHFKDRAVLSSIHRLHLLGKFDQVIVMDQGRIAQTGSFEDLKNQSGLFQTLWDKYQESSKTESV